MNEIKYIERKTGAIKTEHPPKEKLLKFLYNNPFGKLSLNLIVKRKFLSSVYGRMMNSTKSKVLIKKFIESNNINTKEFPKKVSEFKTFNDFFTRKLNKKRKISKDLISPADGKIIAFQKISKLKSFFLKGDEFTLEKFLRDKSLAKKYKNHSLVIVRLCPGDYHRFHAPYLGVVSKSTKINGKYFSVSPFSVSKNFVRVFCENKREYMELKTPKKGDILISPIGATMIGSIVETYSPDSKIKKGDELGYFSFGGSSVLLLVKNFKIDKDILKNTKKGFETSIKMGETIAH